MRKPKYGLIGFPLAHSRSPVIHKKLFEISEINADYSLHEIEPDKLSDNYDFLKDFRGFNITIPHKINIIPFCEKLDETAKEIGAVNCVYKKKGYNTDVYGFLKSIEILGVDLNSKVCILGFGGAGRMAAIVAQKMGSKVTVAVRNPEKVKDKRFKAEKLNELEGNFDLIINTTPCGAFPNIWDCPVDFLRVKTNYAFDMTYNPAKTLFLQNAEKIGAKIISGLPMLIWQAVRSHEIWYDAEFSNDDIMTLIEEIDLGI